MITEIPNIEYESYAVSAHFYMLLGTRRSPVTTLILLAARDERVDHMYALQISCSIYHWLGAVLHQIISRNSMDYLMYPAQTKA